MLVISAALLKLDQQDMRELGLSLGHIKKLSARIQQDPSPGADKFFREQQRKSATTRTSFKLDHCLEKIRFCRILL